MDDISATKEIRRLNASESMTPSTQQAEGQRTPSEQLAVSLFGNHCGLEALTVSVIYQVTI